MFIQNFPLHQNHLFKINLLLNTTEIFLVSESCLMEVWSFHKIIVLSESPHLMGFLEGFQILKQNSEYMSNDPLMRCTCWMKELQNPFACDADQHFDAKVKCPTRRASFWDYFPTVQSKTSVKCPGRGRDGQFGIDWYITQYMSLLLFDYILI